MRKRILAIALLGSLLLSGCAKNEIDEIINESAEEISVEASDEASAQEYELATAEDSDESTDEASDAESSVDAEEITTDESTAEETDTEISGSIEEIVKAIDVKYDDSDYCGYYYREGYDSAYLVISAGEESGTYDITFYHEDLGKMTGTGIPREEATERRTIDFESDDGRNTGFFMFNPANVMLTLIGIDNNGEPRVKLNLFPLKAE